MDIYKHFASDVPKPVICEMGGKNPAIVSRNADLDVATDGVLRSAFGFGGQKCSANSRVYVEREVYDDFLDLLKQKTERIKVGNPLERETYLGPIINEVAMDTFEEASAEAKKNGNVVTGGERIDDGDLRPRPVRAADDRGGARGQLALEEGALRSVRGGRAVRRARRGDREGERHRVRPDGRLLQRGPRRDRRMARQDPGRRRLREPAGGRDHRRVAGRPAVRRAGRGRGPAARPAAAPTTSSSTCGSSRAR